MMKSNRIGSIVRAFLITVTLLTVGLSSVQAKEQNVHDRMLYHRAIDAAVWAMPLMNFKFYRDALAGVGVGPNDVGYFSKLQDWRFQTATPNNTTPYIMTYWNFKNGPALFEKGFTLNNIELAM